jgi:serine phosphatase RsbU (regulator of sigma subunit)
MRRTCLFLLLILLSQIIFAQKYLPVNKYTAESGLTDNYITCLYTDHKGFLWIGTKNGLNKYNGYSFEQFKADLSDKQTLPGAEVLDILEDYQNQLWVLTNLGISKFNRSENSFQTFFVYNDSLDMSIPELLTAVSLNWKRNEFLILGKGSMSILDIGSEKMRRVRYPENISPETFGLINNIVYDGLSDDYYLYSGKNLLILNRENDIFIPVNLSEAGLKERNGEIRGLCFSVKGECWIYAGKHFWILNKENRLITGNSDFLPADETIQSLKPINTDWLEIITASSCFRYDTKSENAKLLYQFEIPVGEDAPFITDYMETDDGVFWVATPTGLLQFNQHNEAFLNMASAKYFSDEDNIQSIAYDLNNNLWLLSSSGEIRVINSSAYGKKESVLAGKKISVPARFIHAADKRDTVFLGSEEGLYYLLRKKKDLVLKKLSKGKVEAIDQISSDTLLLFTDDSLIFLSPGGIYKPVARKISNVIDEPVIDLFSYRGSVFILQDYQLVKYSLKTSESTVLTLSGLGMNTLPGNTCFVASSSREVITGTKMGLFIYYLDDLKVLPSYVDIPSARVPVMTLLQGADQRLWFSSASSLFTLDRNKQKLRIFGLSEGLIPVKDGYKNVVQSSSGEICFAGKEGAVVFHPDSVIAGKSMPKVEITHVKIYTRMGVEEKYMTDLDTLNIKSRNTLLQFSCAVLDFWNPRENRFQYNLSKADKESEWIELPTGNSFDISKLKIGEYTLKVRGINSRNVESQEPDVIIIQVVAPVWQSKMAILAYVILVILTFYFSIFFTTRQLRKMNRQYKERELIARKVEQQKEELTQKNKNITDSINYAKRIQMALMPPRKLFGRIFQDSFILHIPKDIVSGDFYWINEVEGRIYFAAVDCTGHGVPGAFMSIIGFELLRRITEIEKKKKPSEILNSLSLGFETIFRDIEDITLRDGMDVAFCAIDQEMKVLEFSGAFNPLYLIRDNTISEIKGERFSVGLHQADDGSSSQQFLDHVIQLKDGDILYIFTDGYADQFGGPEGKKYKYRRFRHLLLALHQLPMERQVEFLQRSIMDWKGELDQVDDILVMGIRISHKVQGKSVSKLKPE